MASIFHSRPCPVDQVDEALQLLASAWKAQVQHDPSDKMDRVEILSFARHGSTKGGEE